MERLTIKAPSGLITLKNHSESWMNLGIKRLSDYEDTGLSPEQIHKLLKQKLVKKPVKIQEIDVQENVEQSELRKSFVNRVADILISLNEEAETEAENDLVLLIAVAVKDNIEFIPNGDEN